MSYYCIVPDFSSRIAILPISQLVHFFRDVVDVDAPSMAPSSSVGVVCSDDPVYRSPFNDKFGCNLYEPEFCSKWRNVLSPEDFEEVLKRCPVSCGVPCV